MEWAFAVSMAFMFFCWVVWFFVIKQKNGVEMGKYDNLRAFKALMIWTPISFIIWSLIL